MNKSEKTRQIATLVDGNSKVTAELLAESVTIRITETDKTISVSLNQEWNEILFKVNDFLFANKIPAIGNFGAYSQAKVAKLTKGNEALDLLSNGDLEIPEYGITIEINYFHPLQLIIDNINKTILDINEQVNCDIKVISI